jgi:hypothetical protein
VKLRVDFWISPKNDSCRQSARAIHAPPISLRNSPPETSFEIVRGTPLNKFIFIHFFQFYNFRQLFVPDLYFSHATKEDMMKKTRHAADCNIIIVCRHDIVLWLPPHKEYAISNAMDKAFFWIIKRQKCAKN